MWYQKAEFGDVWIPYLHVRLTPAQSAAEPEPVPTLAEVPAQAPTQAQVYGIKEVYSFTG
ncbi:MAG: hypothetical protein J7493_12285 [Porphyrobacter sp.]|nr:hypothetical protein [Porphyrobacter sp.]